MRYFCPVNCREFTMKIKLAFEENVLSVINKILDENSNIFEDEYFNVTNNNIKNTFIQQYTNIINKQTSSLLQFIQENKNDNTEDEDYNNRLIVINQYCKCSFLCCV